MGTASIDLTDLDPFDRTLRLRDGRAIGFAEYGDPSGIPWMFFHGGGDCRRLFAPMSDVARESGVRLIAPDRWGISLSDYRPGGTLLDWPADVQELADSLGLNRFVVAGGGCGAAYALACASTMPDRLSATVVVEPAAPGLAGDVPSLLSWLPARAPWFVAQVLQLRVRALRRTPDSAWRKRLAKAREGTRAFYAQPGMQQYWQDMQREAYRRGTRAVANDFMLLARPWGFDLQGVSARVYIWQPENDKHAADAARLIASQLPDCRATFIPGVDRLWTLAHGDEVFATINAASTLP